MVHKASVLVVEDNSDMRKAISEYLTDSGYIVNTASSAEEAKQKSMPNKSDIAILDISLPGITGLSFTKELKSQGFDGPIIAITARDTVEDKIIGLSVGMDDYIVKPFDLRELVARINAQLRSRGAHHDLSPIQTTNFKIEPKRHRFFVKDKEVKLTLVEFRIMLKLMQNNHTTVQVQDLIEYAWGESAILARPPIRIHISNIRSKINDNNLTILQTIPGVGYLLND